MNSATRAVLLTLALGGLPASAQTPDAVDVAPSGMPRSILPPQMSIPPEPGSSPADAVMPAPDAAPALEPAPEATLESQMGRFNANASAVVVGDLGTLEGPIAGTLEGMDGLGDDAWARSDRTTIIGMLQTAPAATPSAASSLLLRKALLTTAAPPPGRSDRSFNALRLSKLLDAALVNDAADLAARVQAPMNPEILQLQADAFIRAGRDFDACGDLTARRLQSAERFWVQLRAFCYAVNRDLPALDLTRSVIADQGLSDPAFLVMLDGLASGQAMAPEAIALPDPLHVLMLSRLNLPMNAEIATGLSLADSLTTAASVQTPPALRIAAAEKALRAGVLPTDLFAQILELTAFGPGVVTGASALARAEPLMPALARLRGALRMTASIEQRADLIHTALEIGENAGLLRQVALLFVQDAAAILPASNWGNWSDLYMRALLLAGRPDVAVRWFDIASIGAPSSDMANQLQLTFAFAAPAQADSLTTLALLRGLALTANPPPPAPPEPPPPAVLDPLATDQPPPPEPPPPLPPPPPPSEALIARATLVLGLYDALTRALPAEAQEAVQPLVSQQSPGRRPPQVLMQRIDRASLAGARGEVALGVIAALGTQGARDLAPDIVVRLVRALQTAGIRDGAREVALEAFLLRPVASVVAGEPAQPGASALGGR